MVHKPAGVWKKPWYSVTYAVPEKTHSGSTPFQNAKDIPKQVDAAKETINWICRDTLGRPEIEIIRVKEDPWLPFHDEDEGEVEWTQLFNIDRK